MIPHTNSNRLHEPKDSCEIFVVHHVCGDWVDSGLEEGTCAKCKLTFSITPLQWCVQQMVASNITDVQLHTVPPKQDGEAEQKRRWARVPDPSSNPNAYLCTHSQYYVYCLKQKTSNKHLLSLRSIR